MDINKFKSVAVRKPDYDLLQGLCNEKFRSPHFVTTVNEYSLESRSTLCSWIKEIENEK